MTNPPSGAPEQLRPRLRELFERRPRRVAIRWCVLLGLVLLAGYLLFPQIGAYYHSWQAGRALAAQDCAAARRHLERCLEAWTGSGQCHFDAARCCWREGDLEAAAWHLREAGRLGWPKRALNSERLFIYAQQSLTRELDEALAAHFKSAQESQDSATQELILEALVLGNIRAGMFDRAENAAKVLLAKNEACWRPHWLMGRAVENVSTTLARESYERSLALRSDQPRVHFWLAKYYARRGEAQLTLDHLAKSDRDLSDDLEAALVKARGNYLLGRWPETRTALNQALAHGGERHARTLALRGLVELEDTGAVQALSWLTKAEALAPHDPEIIEARFILATRQRDDEAMLNCAKRKKHYEAQAAKYIQIQKQHSELRQQPKASAAEKREVTYQMGLVLFQVGEDDFAVKWLRSVLADDPEHHGAHQALAEYFQRIGDAEQAKLHAAKASRSGT